MFCDLNIFLNRYRRHHAASTTFVAAKTNKSAMRQQI